ncbi:TPA: NinE family protein [Escherichia coli]|nr:NinE family protein [Escherichia coli]
MSINNVLYYAHRLACKYLPTKRSRNKRKPIPKESDVKTFNYTAHLWDIRWLRHRARK